MLVVEQAAFAGRSLYPEFFFAQALDMSSEGFLVAEHEGEVVGYVIAVIGQGGKRQGWLQSLGVHPAHQRRGVGSNLTARAEEFLAQEGQKEAVLTVAPENTVARRLYSRLGYTEIERLEDYFGEGDDRLLMALPLVEPTSGKPAIT